MARERCALSPATRARGRVPTPGMARKRFPAAAAAPREKLCRGSGSGQFLPLPPFPFSSSRRLGTLPLSPGREKGASLKELKLLLRLRRKGIRSPGHGPSMGGVGAWWGTHVGSCTAAASTGRVVEWTWRKGGCDGHGPVRRASASLS
jgi:hypothetical protein